MLPDRNVASVKVDKSSTTTDVYQVHLYSCARLSLFELHIVLATVV